ncbi:MAG: alkaline phosphatase family protein, partial [Gammaproteobacteria bacterium]
MRLTVLLLTVLSSYLAGCAGGGAGTIDRAADDEAPPRLVVLVVIDQLGQWVLEEHLGLLPPDSLLRRAWEEGSRHIVAFPYATTATAAGHATIATGVVPAVHGAHANAIHDPAVGRRPVVDDRRHGVIGNAESYVSPAVLRVDTVGDRLH